MDQATEAELRALFSMDDDDDELLGDRIQVCAGYWERAGDTWNFYDHNGLRIASNMKVEELSMDNQQIKHMTDRFLTWRLPANFNPDAGISYQRPNYHPDVVANLFGTNLLDAQQAEAMVRHLVEDLPAGTINPGAARPSVLYRPILSADGHMWCALYGADLQEGVAGFGKTPALAMEAFDDAWVAEKTPMARKLAAGTQEKNGG